MSFVSVPRGGRRAVERCLVLLVTRCPDAAQREWALSKHPGTMGTLRRRNGFVPGLVTVPEITKGRLSPLGRRSAAQRGMNE